MIDFVCPHCERVLRIPKQYVGQTGKCNHCGKTIKVTAPAEAPSQAHMQSQSQSEAVNDGSAQGRPHPESKYWDLELNAVPPRDKMTIVRWAESEMKRGIPRAVLVEQLIRSVGTQNQSAVNAPPIQAAEHLRRHGVQAFQNAMSYTQGHRKDIALTELQKLVNQGDLTGDAYDAMREIYEEMGEYDKAAQACRDYMALVDVVLAKGWIRNAANAQTLRGKRQQFEREIKQMERRSRRSRAQAGGNG